MLIRHAGANASCSRPLSVSQVNKGRQDRRMFKPKRVASTWQENISAQVKSRSENRWRVSRPQPLLATFLQFMMLFKQVKSVGSVPEALLCDSTALAPVHGATALIDSTALVPLHGATALPPAYDTVAPVPSAAMVPLQELANNSGHGNWNIPGVAGCKNVNLPITKSLNNLPSELLSMIGTHLPAQDIGRLSQVNRRLHNTLAQENRAGRLVTHAQRATQLIEFRALLGNSDNGGAGIRGLRMSLQKRPLAALIGRTRLLPGAERFAGFRLIHDAANDARLPMALPLRAAALTELATQIRVLNPGDRWPAFKLAHHAVTVDRFPMTARVASLAELATQIRLLDTGDRWAGFKRIHGAITVAGFPIAARSAALTELARQTAELNAGDRWPAFKLLHDATTAATFPIARRAAPLTGLAWRIPDLRAPDRPDAHRRVLSAVVKLDKQNRGAALEVLAISIICLPEHARGPALYALQSAIAELDLLDRGAPFDMLALALSVWLMSGTSDTLRQFVVQIDWLPDHRRAQMLGAFQQP
jgi:hypothetical protein